MTNKQLIDKMDSIIGSLSLKNLAVRLGLTDAFVEHVQVSIATQILSRWSPGSIGEAMSMVSREDIMVSDDEYALRFAKAIAIPKINGENHLIETAALLLALAIRQYLSEKEEIIIRLKPRQPGAAFNTPAQA